MRLLVALFRELPTPLAVGVVLFVLLVGATGTLLLGGATGDLADGPDAEITVDTTDLTLRLNDEQPLPDTNRSVVTCIASGTPRDSVSLLGDIHVEIPASYEEGFGERTRQVVVSPAYTEETRTETIEGTGTFSVSLFWLEPDDETLSVGETTTLTVRVLEDGETIAAANRSLSVEAGSRSYDC